MNSRRIRRGLCASSQPRGSHNAASPELSPGSGISHVACDRSMTTPDDAALLEFALVVRRTRSFTRSRKGSASWPTRGRSWRRANVCGRLDGSDQGSALGRCQPQQHDDSEASEPHDSRLEGRLSDGQLVVVHGSRNASAGPQSLECERGHICTWSGNGGSGDSRFLSLAQWRCAVASEPSSDRSASPGRCPPALRSARR